MKLRLITEDIARSEFFDFYALQYAYTTLNDIDKPEIRRALEYVTNHIFNDHIDQLSLIALNRIADFEHPETAEILARNGIDIIDYAYIGIDDIPAQQRIRMLEEILPFGHIFRFTGKTWFQLGRDIIKLAHTPPNLSARILAIDKIYNLLHHGGQLSDYMDESNWLEDALNIRDNANPPYLLSQTSRWVRELIGSALRHTGTASQITELQKLHTALRRAAKDGVSIKFTGDKLLVSVRVTAIDPLDYESGMTRSYAWGDELTEWQRLMIDSGRYKLGKQHTATMEIRETANKLILTAGGSTEELPKPINRQYHLATDIMLATARVAFGEPIGRGLGVSNIKHSYFYKNKRPVKF